MTLKCLTTKSKQRVDDGTNGVQERERECMNAKGIIKMVGERGGGV